MRGRGAVSLGVAVCLVPAAIQGAHAQGRRLLPEDLFNIERVGGIVWSSNRSAAAVEIHRPGPWLGTRPSTADIAVLDAASGALRTISPSLPEIIGFFGAAWAPDGRRLAFLSVDRDAEVGVWVWTVGSGSAVRLTELTLHDGLADSPVVMWRDSDNVVFMARDASLPNAGRLHVAIQRGRNASDLWARAYEGAEAAVSVIDSAGAGGSSRIADGNGSDEAVGPQQRIVSVNVDTGAITTLAHGPVHRPRLSGEGRILSYWRETPPFAADPVSSFFGADAQGEVLYDRVNLGGELHHLDLVSGEPVAAPAAGHADPESEARPSLRVVADPTAGTRLLLSRPGHEDVEVWHGNGWVRDIEAGRAEAISYRSVDGAELTGWILYPPGHVEGRSIPLVTMVYPGTLYGAREPRSFSLLNQDFEHPQLFAARGYGVVLPSMPAAEAPLQVDAIAELTAGVLPLLDTLVERGIGDPERLALLGQSGGGWATLGLIATTDRFRTAIASASYSNLVSLYGSFYGQYRYGDSGDPRRAQVLRMLQFERGFYGAGAPPWEEPERYRVNSPIWRAADVRTPLLMVHGDIDFIPVQQAEEFFTALYRRDQRVRLLRYAGEGHTISARANVLDLWRHFDAWLGETMLPGDPGSGERQGAR